jgi:hypothetical protein
MPITDKKKRREYDRNRRKQEKELIEKAKLSLGIPLDRRKKIHREQPS